MRVIKSKNSLDGQPGIAQDVALSKDAAVALVELEAINEYMGEARNNTSTFICQMIMAVYKRNKTGTRFSDLVKLGDKTALAALSKMDELGIRPPRYAGVAAGKEADPPTAGQ